MKYGHRPIMNRLRQRFEHLYGSEDIAIKCMDRLDAMVGRYGVGEYDHDVIRHLDQTDSILITYGDMIHDGNRTPLECLKHFTDKHLIGAINTIHILPFFPYSSDDGFSIIDYRTVDPALGSWADMTRLREHFSLMFDLVLNHCSQKNEWFQDYVSGIAPGRHYFIEMDPDTDLSAVVRPRNLPLLTRTQTPQGERHVWTTFSEDQIDLNFANPDVLFEFIDILFQYIAQGATILRLDAIAYLWKQPGTSCIHLEPTHEVVKILRDVITLVAPYVFLLTETNVPHEENISYFGQGDEAQIIYQFPLPPLLLHTLVTADATHLTQWAANLSEPPENCTYLNFTASHDGIGVRPLEGLLNAEQLNKLLEHVKERGGHISCKRNADDSESAYELNITYFDALGSPTDPDETTQSNRFLCSQIIALSMQGIPAIYFNNLIGARNDYQGLEKTGRARSINRHKWDINKLDSLLDDETTTHSKILWEYVRILHIRADHPAFHPNGKQQIFDFGPEFFALERTAPDQSEKILCISNITSAKQTLDLKKHLTGKQEVKDLLSDQPLTGKNNKLTLAPYQNCWLTI